MDSGWNDVREAQHEVVVSQAQQTLDALAEYDRTRNDMRLLRDLRRITLDQERQARRFTCEHPLGTWEDAQRAEHAEMYPWQERGDD